MPSSENAITVIPDSAENPTRQRSVPKEEMQLQKEEAKEEAEEDYFSTDADQADNPDFDDDIPGDDHDEEFLGNEGDPELYNE